MSRPVNLDETYVPPIYRLARALHRLIGYPRPLATVTNIKK